MGRADRRRAAPTIVDDHRLAYVSRGAGQLVPGPGHRAGQRGGHRRRPQRARQLPGVQAQPAAVDDAHHRLRRPAARRPGPAGLAGDGQGDAAQLDRPVRRARSVDFPIAGRRPIEVFTTRPDTLFGATYMVLAPEHPLVDALVAGAVAGRHRRRAWTGGARDPGRGGRGVPRGRRRRSPTWSGRPKPRTKTGVFTGAYATNPVNGDADPGLHRRLRADGLRHRRDHGGARPGRAGLGVRRRRSACRSSGRCSRRRASDGEAFTGDGPAINSANDEISPERAGRRRGQGGDHRLAGRQRARRARRSRTSCGTGCSAGSGTGASRSRSSTTRPACRIALPESMLPVELPEVADYSPMTFDPDDADIRAGAAAGARRPSGSTSSWTWATGRKRYTRETNMMPQWAGSLLVRAALPRPAQRRSVLSTRRTSAYWMGPDAEHGRRPRRRRPVRRRRRARGAAPAVRAVLAQGAVRPGPRVSRRSRSAGCSTRATSRRYAYTDARGVYVPAAEVVERDGESSTTAGRAGQPRVREDGQVA